MADRTPEQQARVLARISARRAKADQAEEDLRALVAEVMADRRGLRAEDIAAAAGWSRPRLYQMLATRRGQPYQ